MDELSLGNGTVGFHSFTLSAAVQQNLKMLACEFLV